MSTLNSRVATGQADVGTGISRVSVVRTLDAPFALDGTANDRALVGRKRRERDGVGGWRRGKHGAARDHVLLNDGKFLIYGGSASGNAWGGDRVVNSPIEKPIPDELTPKTGTTLFTDRSNPQRRWSTGEYAPGSNARCST